MGYDLNQLLEVMHTQRASDLYLTVGFPPALRTSQNMQTLGQEPLTDLTIQSLIADLVNEEQLDEFDATLEFNASILWQEKMRLRINLLRQQQHHAAVLRRIETEIPTTEELGLPPIYKSLIERKRGLILLVGPTGSGKSSSLASMIHHRNHFKPGHIITIEDPIEFVHTHGKCIITQRDVGIDTYSYGMALKNALRQRPDVVLIGEVRDRETMEHALTFSETGHLCLATLHANNASQALERIVSFFPEEKHRQILLTLSITLQGILSQRLMQANDGGLYPLCEVLLNEGLIRSHIIEGKYREVRDQMNKHRDLGMQTFDSSLVGLVRAGRLTDEQAIAEADYPADLRAELRTASVGSIAQDQPKAAKPRGDQQPAGSGLVGKDYSDFAIAEQRWLEED